MELNHKKMSRVLARDALLCLAGSAKWSNFFIKDGDRALASIVLGCLPTGRDLAAETYDASVIERRCVAKTVEIFKTCYSAWVLARSCTPSPPSPYFYIEARNTLVGVFDDQYTSDNAVGIIAEEIRAFLVSDGWARELETNDVSIRVELDLPRRRIKVRFDCFGFRGMYYGD